MTTIPSRRRVVQKSLFEAKLAPSVANRACKSDVDAAEPWRVAAGLRVRAARRLADHQACVRLVRLPFQEMHRAGGLETKVALRGAVQSAAPTVPSSVSAVPRTFGFEVAAVTFVMICFLAAALIL